LSDLTQSDGGGVFFRLRLAFCLLGCCLGVFACQVTFLSDGNRRSRSGQSLVRTLYVPSAVDQTAQGALAARVTLALQRELVRYPNLRLTSQNEAAAAVDLRIVSQSFQVVSIAECDTKDTLTRLKKIGSEAYRCGDIALTGAQADLASETEALHSAMRVTIVDLNTGKTLASAEYPVKSATFAVVGPTTLASALSDRPQFHALRYAENRDQARDDVADQLARRIVPMLLNLRSQP
jgi:hypothetical protein